MRGLAQKKEVRRDDATQISIAVRWKSQITNV